MKHFEKAVTRAPVAALTVVALLGWCIQASAQTQCPELARLRGAAQEALKQSRIAPSFERCCAYNRLSEAWNAVAQYARDNRQACQVALTSLDDFERYHRDAVKDRDNVCAGRLRHPFPPEIIRH